MKTCGQLNLQTQRLFGQQALAEFQKVHIDPNRIKVINDKIEGFRKNTCLINTGNNVSAKEAQRRRQAHTEKYGIPENLYNQIIVPIVLDAPKDLDGLVDDIEKLREMYRCVYDIELRLKHLKTNPSDTAGVKVAMKTSTKNSTAQKPVPKKEESTDSKEDTKGKTNSNSMEMATPAKAMPSSPVMPPADTMDDDIAMAMALSASMANANINTPAIEAKTKRKAKKSAKKSSKKKKSAKKSAKKSSAKKSSKKKNKNLGRKRKKAVEGDEEDALPDEPVKRAKH